MYVGVQNESYGEVSSNSQELRYLAGRAFGKMKVLIACEESQEVCKAFRAKGHEAYSCDIQEPSGGHPEWHILGDALKAIEGGQVVTMDGVTHDVGKWDLLIAHPPCTYLSNAGARFLYPKGVLNEQRLRKGLMAKDFFLHFL